MTQRASGMKMVSRPTIQMTMELGSDAGGDGDPAQAQGRDHVEHHEIAEAQHALGMGRAFALRRRGDRRTRFHIRGE